MLVLSFLSYGRQFFGNEGEKGTKTNRNAKNEGKKTDLQIAFENEILVSKQSNGNITQKLEIFEFNKATKWNEAFGCSLFCSQNEN